MGILEYFYKYRFFRSAMLQNREQLGSISSIEENLTENETKDRNARIASNYKMLERIVAEYIKEQKDFLANQCENENQLLFSRGTINGLYLISEAFKSYKGQHDEITKSPEQFNPHKVI